jgi:hypothetical protein
VIKYRVLDLPVKGAGAFTPLPSTNPVASSYGLVHVSGSPGTTPIPMPKLGWLPDLTSQDSGPNTARGEDVTPYYILPAIYVASAKNMGPQADLGIGMAIRRRNPLPVPARNPGRMPVPVQMRFPMGGSQLPWPRAFQRWPNRGQQGSTLGV